MKNHSKLIALQCGCLLITLSGCGNTNDPTQGGFLGGLGGLSTGSYALAEADLVKERDQSKKVLATSLDEKSREAAGLRSTTAKVKVAKERTASLRTELADIEREVDGLTASTAAARRKNAELKAEIFRMEKERAALAVGPTSGICATEAICKSMVSDLEREIADLRAEVKSLETRGSGL